MNIRYSILVFIGAMFALSSCNKGQWKETVKSAVHFRASTMSLGFGANTLVLDTLIVRIGNFSLAGDRIQADDIYLMNSAVVTATFTGIESEVATSFDIPQGTYNDIQFTSKFDGTASLLISGTYYSPSGSSKKVLITLDNAQYLIKNILDAGTETVQVDTDHPKNIVLILNTEVLFDEINPSYWNAATQSVIAGQQAIQVSPSQNGNLHSLIEQKVQDAITYEYE
jgi:hypothetical protein